MKKIILSITLAGVTSICFAQSFAMGVKAGPNLASLSYNSEGFFSSTAGLHLGVVAEVAMGNFALQPGILYTTKGSSYGLLSSTPDIKLNYLEIPINLLYYFREGKGKFFVGGGPYWGYGLSANSGINYGSAKDEYNNPDIGIDIIVGYRFKTDLFLSTNYGFGITNLSNYSYENNKNEVLSFSVGYFFL